MTEDPSNTEAEHELVISYLELRRAIGYLAVAFPPLLLVGAGYLFGYDVQPSISDYHHTPMRDVFAGVLFGIGLFLFSYRGPEAIDNVAGNVACMAVIGVAIFPNNPSESVCQSGCLIGWIHLACATVFFLTLIFFAMYLFTKSDAPVPTGRKRIRNKVYITCGLLMSACIASIAVYFLFSEGWLAFLKPFHPIYWLESIAVESFGFCWLVKGGWILKDLQVQAQVSSIGRL